MGVRKIQNFTDIYKRLGLRHERLKTNQVFNEMLEFVICMYLVFAMRFVFT